MRTLVVCTGTALALAIFAPQAEAKRGRGDITKFAPLTADGMPNVQSGSAVVLDLESGTVFYDKNPDEVRPIASTGKIFVAMVVRKKKIDLEASTTISEIDAKYARGGARTRLPVGHTFKNGDLLRAMLVASDNRACTALGRAVGLSPDQLIAEMNKLARELGLSRTRFTDPSGLNGNESTAREMAIAFRAALGDAVLAEILGTKTVEVKSVGERPRVVSYRNTNKLIHRDSNHIIGGKTGYTDAAGYCLLVAAENGGRDVCMVFLGAHGKLTRFGDFGRVRDWLKSKFANRDAGEKGEATAEAKASQSGE